MRDGGEEAVPLIPMVEALRGLAEARPEAPALTVEGEGTLSWGELDRRTSRLARTFEGLGVEEGDFVTIGLPNSLGFIEAAIAALKLGAVPQMVSHRLPERERAAIVELAGSKLVLSEPLDVDGTLDDSPLPVRVSPSWKAPTSGGSTGRPKLIVDGSPATVDPEAPSVLLPSGAAVLVPGPLYHNGPYVIAMQALFHGNHVIVERRFDAALTLDLIERHRVHYVLLVPTMMHRIWRLPAEEREARDLSSLQVVFHLASSCPGWLKEAWIEWLGPWRIFELYGGTEAQALTIISGAEWLEHRGSVGRPVTGEMRILGADGAELPPGEVGEIWMRRGPDAEPTYRYMGADAQERDGWETIGDLGWMDEDGYVYISDRRTDLILAGGANVYPAEVEAALDEHPAVRSCVVIGLPDDDLGQRVHAIVQTDGDVGEDELREHMAARLVSYKLPRSYEFVAEPLRDDAGKVRRSAMREVRS
jgi:bile acid-coenzyme A ligase